MNDLYIFFRGYRAFTTHDSGYSGDFSWWRSTFNPRLFSVCGHNEFCESGLAVTDDFGNLVRVPA